ncbi:hypothetical protein JT359_08680 [Candidatus Poribacteria bacterium]|nr:hypothetical protein [Candidatus Poribacteria bacterium]
MKEKLSVETRKWSEKIRQVANRAVKKAQEENRKKGIPNVYDFNGHLYYELPNGELTKSDPLLSTDQRNSEKS